MKLLFVKWWKNGACQPVIFYRRYDQGELLKFCSNFLPLLPRNISVVIIFVTHIPPQTLILVHETDRFICNPWPNNKLTQITTKQTQLTRKHQTCLNAQLFLTCSSELASIGIFNTQCWDGQVFTNVLICLIGAHGKLIDIELKKFKKIFKEII